MRRDEGFMMTVWDVQHVASSFDHHHYRAHGPCGSVFPHGLWSSMKTIISSSKVHWDPIREIGLFSSLSLVSKRGCGTRAQFALFCLPAFVSPTSPSAEEIACLWQQSLLRHHVYKAYCFRLRKKRCHLVKNASASSIVSFSRLPFWSTVLVMLYCLAPQEQHLYHADLTLIINSRHVLQPSSSFSYVLYRRHCHCLPQFALAFALFL